MPLRADLGIVGIYVKRYNRLRRTVGVTVGALWDRYAGLDDRAADDFADHAARLVAAGQVQAAAGVDGYLAAITTILLGVALRPDPVRTELITGAALRNGTEPLDVYRRGIIAARTATTRDVRLAEALAIGRARSVSAAETDIALAQRAAMGAAVDGVKIVGYRRVLTGESCAFCAVASTQRYLGQNLMPLHSHCDCGVAPIIGAADPGHIINRQLLAELKQAARTAGVTDYWKNRRITVEEDGTVTWPDVTVRQHGELGPVLVDSSDHFTGPAGVAA